MALLSTGNPKTAKGAAKGFLTFILHLAPAKLSGYNVCQNASPACAKACLNTAGRGGIFQSIQVARLAKTLQFFEQRDTFLSQIVLDIEAGIRKASREGLTPVFRLNGTSDLPWERIPIDVTVGKGKRMRRIVAGNIFEAFPTVTFYDYTKVGSRTNLPANYSLTFSRSESNEAESLQWLANGGNVAVVFSTKRGKALPATWNGYTVIDGDETDLRFLDPKGVVVGLRAKGKARQDDSGFVVPV